MAQRRRTDRHSTAQPPVATESKRAQVPAADAESTNTSPVPHLAIYVAEHCEVCQYALEVAEWIRQAYPHVDLQVVDINRTTEPVPESVFATPTYLLDGRVWSLGNPSTAQVRAAFGAPANAG